LPCSINACAKSDSIVSSLVGEGLGGLDELRDGVEAEDKAHTVVRPAGEVDGLRERRIPAQEDILEAGAPAELDRAIEVAGRTFVRRPIAAAIDDEERLAGVGERDEQRVVAPDTVVGDAHALPAIGCGVVLGCDIGIGIGGDVGFT
jgi:hypothetical protein